MLIFGCSGLKAVIEVAINLNIAVSDWLVSERAAKVVSNQMEV